MPHFECGAIDHSATSPRCFWDAIPVESGADHNRGQSLWQEGQKPMGTVFLIRQKVQAGTPPPSAARNRPFRR